MRWRTTGILVALLILTVAGTLPLGAQDEVWIDPNRSDQNRRRILIMNGNNDESMVGNWGNVGQGSNPISGVWPRGSGHDHIHEFTGIAAAISVSPASSSNV